jgi:hypothetical protein
MPQMLQEALLPHTADLDIAVCNFTLLDQIIDKLGLVDDTVWDKEVQMIKELASRRPDICEEKLDVPESVGKPILTEVINGGSWW